MGLELYTQPSIFKSGIIIEGVLSNNTLYVSGNMTVTDLLSAQNTITSSIVVGNNDLSTQPLTVYGGISATQNLYADRISVNGLSSINVYPLSTRLIVVANNGPETIRVRNKSVNQSDPAEITFQHSYSGADFTVNRIAFGIAGQNRQGFIWLNNNDIVRFHQDGKIGIVDLLPSLSAQLGSKFNVNGNVSIGTAFSATPAPQNGLLVFGNIGVGTSVVDEKLTVSGNISATGNIYGDRFIGTIPTEIGVACSDEVSDLSVGTKKLVFRMPYTMTLDSVRGSLNTASSGVNLIVDINKDDISVLSTKLQFASGEKTTTTCPVQPVISTSILENDTEISVDIDQVGGIGAGAGLKVWLLGYRA